MAKFEPIRLASGKLVPIRFVAEQHVMEDLGRIPTAADWLRTIQGEPWMVRVARRLSREVPEDGIVDQPPLVASPVPTLALTNGDING